jgi:hypothetical protein
MIFAQAEEFTKQNTARIPYKIIARRISRRIVEVAKRLDDDVEGRPNIAE